MEYRIGDIVVITANISGHFIPTGEMCTILNNEGEGVYCVRPVNTRLGIDRRWATSFELRYYKIPFNKIMKY